MIPIDFEVTILRVLFTSFSFFLSPKVVVFVCFLRGEKASQVLCPASNLIVLSLSTALDGQGLPLLQEVEPTALPEDEETNAESSDDTNCQDDSDHDCSSVTRALSVKRTRVNAFTKDVTVRRIE